VNPGLLSLCGDSVKPSPLWGEGRVRGEVREAPGPYARRLRRDQTDVELKLWWRLRNRQLCGAKFRRQHPVGSFIVDFCCPEARLVIEVDGGHHAVQREADARRTTWLEGHGNTVLRFWDNDVLANMEGVLERVCEALRDPHPGPLPRRERESEGGGEPRG